MGASEFEVIDQDPLPADSTPVILFEIAMAAASARPLVRYSLAGTFTSTLIRVTDIEDTPVCGY